MIKVSWDKPADLGNPAMDDGYFVEVRGAGENEWWEEGEFEETSATIAGLQNGREYEVRVIVLNVHGYAIAGPKRATPGGADGGSDG